MASWLQRRYDMYGMYGSGNHIAFSSPRVGRAPEQPIGNIWHQLIPENIIQIRIDTTANNWEIVGFARIETQYPSETASPMFSEVISGTCKLYKNENEV
jgi:hypothetical protein